MLYIVCNHFFLQRANSISVGYFAVKGATKLGSLEKQKVLNICSTMKYM